jgi:hypothetical protein
MKRIKAEGKQLVAIYINYSSNETLFILLLLLIFILI